MKPLDLNLRHINPTTYWPVYKKQNHTMMEQLDNWLKWGEIWNKNEIWEIMNVIVEVN